MRRAEQNVSDSRNRQAERLINQAKKMQAEAEGAALQRNICLATSGYEHANNSLREALKLVEGPLRTPEASLEVTINREKERYENLETRAREAIETGKNASAALVFAQAQKQGRAAEEAWRKGQVALAQQLYRGATRLLLRAIDLALAGKKDQEFGRNETALLQELIQAAEQDCCWNAPVIWCAKRKPRSSASGRKRCVGVSSWRAILLTRRCAMPIAARTIRQIRNNVLTKPCKN
jgi:hypothetical protein